MRYSIVRTILFKELRETLRDRRTLLMTVGLPVLLYPLVILAFTRIAESGEDAIAADKSVVAVWGALPAPVAAALADSKDLTLQPWGEAPEDLRAGLPSGRYSRRDATERAAPLLGRGRGTGPREVEPENAVLLAARAAVASRRVQSVIVAWPDTVQEYERGDAAPLSVYYDSVRRESAVAHERVSAALDDARQRIVVERQRARDLPNGFAQGLDVRTRNTSTAERRSGQLLGSILPYILLTLSVLGGMYAAIDLTAGEKERGTMQTLLCAPITSAEIVLAKFLTVWLLSLLSLVANLASLSMTVSRLLPADLPGVGVTNLVLALAVLLPVTLTTSALFLACASFARDFRDGQTMLTPVYMAVALPAGVVGLPTIELNAWTAFVPIVNVTLLVKALFLREASSELIFLTLLSACLYAAVAMAGAVHVFHRETVLVGEKTSLRTVFERDGVRGGTPNVGFALTAFAVLLVVQFYGGLSLRTLSIPWLLVTLQYGGFLLPTLGMVALFAFDWRKTLALRRPPVVAVAMAVLLGLTAWMFAGGVVGRLLPPPESLTRAMERFIQLGDAPMPLWVVWFVLGVTPGICEELFFRGLVFSGLRRLGAGPAVVASALLFALAHASIYRLMPTFILGLVLGTLRWRSGSVLPGMVMHALNNGLIGTLAQRPALAYWFGMQGASGALPIGPVLVGTVVMLMALGVLTRLTSPADDGPGDGASRSRG
ncbi:MAG: ABC transporter permease subunit/CPBP intramembrane protease [Acidobacteriota bacterium]